MGGLPGVDRRVRAATVDDSGNLYAGGSFTMAGDVPANFIARWDGTNWSALGSGFLGNWEFLATPSPRITALVASGDTLYAGGYFTLAGGKPSAYVAKAFLKGLPLTFDSPIVTKTVLHTKLSGTVSATVVIESSGNLTQWTPVSTNTLSSDSWQLVLPVGSNTHEFFRAGLAP
jgi:hypothetical protein